MPETADQPQPGKSLTGFYIAVGAVACLVGLGVWLWRPLTFAHLERKIASTPYGGRSGDVSGSVALGTPRIALARRLAQAGPATYPNFRRLLTSPDQGLRAEVLSAFHNPEYTWLLPLMVEAARDGDSFTVLEAYAAARSTVGGPNPMRPEQPLADSLTLEQRAEELRKAMLAWWEREGRAKYGEGAK